MKGMIEEKSINGQISRKYYKKKGRQIYNNLSTFIDIARCSVGLNLKSPLVLSIHIGLRGMFFFLIF